MKMRRDYLCAARDLSPYERLDLERHPVIGEQEIARLGLPKSTQLIVRWHHEWWNGEGYPFGLAGNAIPRCARIVAVADVVDALTSVRSYKSAWNLQAALDEVSAQRGRQFEPACVDAMEVVARTLPADWRTTAQAWGLQLTLELGRPARVVVTAA